MLEQSDAGPSSRSFNLEDSEERLLDELPEEPPPKKRRTVRSSTQTELKKIWIIEERKLEHKIKMDEIRTRQRQEEYIYIIIIFKSYITDGRFRLLIVHPHF